MVKCIESLAEVQKEHVDVVHVIHESGDCVLCTQEISNTNINHFNIALFIQVISGKNNEEYVQNHGYQSMV